MKTKIFLNRMLKDAFIIMMVGINSFLAVNASAETPEGNNDKTLSPYFFVQSDYQGVDQLPLQSTTADVNIAGVIADVEIIQEYKNLGESQ